MNEIGNNLAAFRRKRGLSAAALAVAVGVSRQTVYAIEAGSYVPNTAVALRLARALDAAVEDLFTLPDDAAPAELPLERAILMPDAEPLQPGQPVQLSRVDQRLFAAGSSPLPWCLPPSDAVVTGKPAHGKTAVRIFHSNAEAGGDFRNRILIAGCDPSISLLARQVRPAGFDLVLLQRNSTQALQLLKKGCVHIAGTHLRDDASGESNLPEIARMFPKNQMAVITFAVWEEGILASTGNPKAIRGVEDFARNDVRIVNREQGSGSRRLLDAHLQRLGIEARSIDGYERLASGHLPAAWQVHAGEADCCVATGAAARVFGLTFLPLVSERYDLAIHRKHLTFPGVQALLDTLNRSSFRRELESIGGYDTKNAGARML